MAEAFGIACHELVSLDFRCGSKPDEREHRPGGPELGVEQTKSGSKQTSKTTPDSHAWPSVTASLRLGGPRPRYG